MIRKFQQGGSQQEQMLMQFVQQIAEVLQVDPKQVMQAAQQKPEALQQAIQIYSQSQDIQQAAQVFAQAIQKAQHGAKLNYVKRLTRKCPEGEELVYFRKGGKVDCGCLKKAEGGKTTTSWKENFSKRKAGKKFI